MKFIVTLCELVYAVDLLRLMGFSINFQVTIDFLALWLVKIHCLWSDSHWPVTLTFCLFSYSNKFEVNFYEVIIIIKHLEILNN